MSFLPGDVLSDTPEGIFTNCFTVTMPQNIYRWNVAPGFPYEMRDALGALWPFYFVSPDIVISFDTPSADISEGRTITLDGTFEIATTTAVGGIPLRNVVTNLISRAVTSKALSRGLRPLPNGRGVYFPQGLVENDRLRFIGYEGHETFVYVTREKTLWRPGKSEKYRHYLGVEIRVRRDVAPGYVVLLTPTIHVTTAVGEPLPGRSVNSRRKHVSETWTNHHWTNRLLAIADFLSKRTEAIRAGTGENALTISPRPAMMSAPVGINEAAINRDDDDEEAIHRDDDDGIDDFDDDE